MSEKLRLAILYQYDIMGSSKYSFTENQKKLHDTKANLERLVGALMNISGFLRYSTGGDGNAYLKEVDDSSNDFNWSIASALRVLQNISVFNEDAVSGNLIRKPIIIRTSMHYGQALWVNNNLNEVHGKDINDFMKNERLIGVPNGIGITESIYNGITNERIRNLDWIQETLETSIGISNLCYKLSGINSVQLQKKQPDNFIEYFKNNKKIQMIGMMLRGTILNNYHLLAECIRKGLQIEAIIIDPETTQIKEISSRYSWANENGIIADIEQSIDRLRTLNSISANGDSVKLRLLHTIPPFSLYIFHPNQGPNRIWVETYGYDPPGSIPKFGIEEDIHPQWHEFYVDQFEKIWQHGKPREL